MNKKCVPDKSFGSEILPFLCLFHLKGFDWTYETRSFLSGVTCVFFFPESFECNTRICGCNSGEISNALLLLSGDGFGVI